MKTFLIFWGVGTLIALFWMASAYVQFFYPDWKTKARRKLKMTRMVIYWWVRESLPLVWAALAAIGYCIAICHLFPAES